MLRNLVLKPLRGRYLKTTFQSRHTFASCCMSTNYISPCMSQVDDGFEVHPATIRPLQTFHVLQVPGSALRMAPGAGWKCLCLWTLKHHLRRDLFFGFQKRSVCRNSGCKNDWLNQCKLRQTQLFIFFNNTTIWHSLWLHSARIRW